MQRVRKLSIPLRLTHANYARLNGPKRIRRLKFSEPIDNYYNSCLLRAKT